MNFRKAFNVLLRPTGYQIFATFGSRASLTLRPGETVDEAFIANRIAPNRKHLWLVAPPKSGSTWLTVLLKQLLGWPEVALVNGYDRREQEINLLPMLQFPDVNVLSPQQHCRASTPTTDFIKRFNVRPIIGTRNIFDTIVSLRDHLVNESLIMPMAYADEQFRGWPESRQYDFVVEMFTPWFLSYYVSWMSVGPEIRSRLLFVRYEDLAADTLGTLRRVVDFVGESRTDADIARAMERAAVRNTRKNQGITGRGGRQLSDRQKARVLELSRFYDHIDFSPVGID